MLLKEVIYGIGGRNHRPWRQNATVSPNNYEVLYISPFVYGDLSSTFFKGDMRITKGNTSKIFGKCQTLNKY